MLAVSHRRKPSTAASTIGGLRGIEVGEEMSDFGYSPHQIEFQMYYASNQWFIPN